MAGHPAFKRLSGPRQRNCFCDDRPNCAGIYQRRDFTKLFSIRLDDEKQPAPAMVCRFALWDGTRQADEDSRRLQYLPGPFARGAADRVQDHINIVDHLLKLLLLIVNDLIRAEAEQEVAVFRRCGSDRISAAPVSDLNSKGSDCLRAVPYRRPNVTWPDLERPVQLFSI